MRRPQRLIASALLVAFAGALGGCSSGFGGGFDPTDMLDWLDTKKKLPGERKPVFPEGVPGMDQGVPKELYKNNVERQQRELEQQNAAVANAPPPGQPQGQPQAAAQPLEPPPGSKAALKKLKGKPQQAAGAPAADQPAAEVDGEAATAGAEPAPDAAPPPKPKKIVRKRITAPPPDQAQPAQSAQQAPASGAFPAPLPGGTFTR
jgi:hypothetical protein